MTLNLLKDSKEKNSKKYYVITIINKEILNAIISIIEITITSNGSVLYFSKASYHDFGWVINP